MNRPPEYRPRVAIGVDELPATLRDLPVAERVTLIRRATADTADEAVRIAEALIDGAGKGAEKKEEAVRIVREFLRALEAKFDVLASPYERIAFFMLDLLVDRIVERAYRETIATETKPAG